jgi:hypothetical protein
MKRRLFCAVAAFGLGASSPVLADSNWIGVNSLAGAQTPGWFVTPGAEIGVQKLPRFNSTNSVHFPIAFGAPPISVFTPEPSLFGGEYGGTIGYVFRDGAMPPWMGQRVRIGVTGTYMSFSDKASTSGTLGPSAAGVLDLQGRAVLAFNSTGAGLNESLRVTRQGFDLNLRIASDFALAPGWTLTPSAAVFGGRTVDSYNFDSLFTLGGGAPLAFNQFDEKLRTWSLGGDFSAGLTWQPTSALSINVTGRGGLVWQRSHLDGTGCAVFVGLSCSLAPFFANALSNSSVSDSRSRIGFRGGAAVNASLDMRFGILTVGGFFVYDSAVPGVQNPSQATLLVPGTSTGQAARVRFDDAFRYGGIVTMRIPLIWM